MSAAVDGAPEQGFEISVFESETKNTPQRQRKTWDELCLIFQFPRMTACTVATCGKGEHVKLDRNGEPRGCRHKYGTAWSAATYPRGKTRGNDNVESVSLLVLDQDHLTDERLEDTTGKLHRYQYALHSSHSDREGDRCVRVVLALSRPVTREEWPRFWPAVVAMLGIDVDGSCKDASRIYFVPTRPKDAEHCFAVNDGAPIDVDDVLARAPAAPPPPPPKAKQKPKQAKQTADAEPRDDGKLAPGERHAGLTRLAGAMRRQGCDSEAILAALRDYNAKNCDPPKPDAELIEIAGWVGKKAPSAMALAGGAVKMAADYVAKFATHPQGVTLRRWRGDWYRWFRDRGHYVRVSDERIERDLYCDLNLARRADVGDVRHALITPAGVLIDEAELGTWLDDTKADPLDLAPCANGLLHLPSRTLMPPTPRYFSTVALGVGYLPTALLPTRWLAFLDQLWPDDAESIAALQEWLGYLLTADTRQQKILMLIGPKRSGKGTIARVTSALLGAANVASPTLASLGTNFGLSPLIGKQAAIIGDARLGGRSDIAQVVERLLSISGEDLQTIDRKHREPWTGKLSTRLTIISNELPRFTDASDALSSRMLMLELHRSFYGQEDMGLTDALVAELPGILHWAIDGWARLRARGRFVQPSKSAEAIHELTDLASPVAAWVRQECRTDGDDPAWWLEPSVAYAKFCAWCERAGHHKPSQTTFGRDIKTATGCQRKQVWRNGRDVWTYAGLVLTGLVPA